MQTNLLIAFVHELLTKQMEQRNLTCLDLNASICMPTVG